MNKYHARKTKVDGYVFDSIAESRRYAELKLLEKAGEIRAGTIQVHEPIFLHAMNGCGESFSVGEFRPDFTYIDRHMRPIAEDVKGQDRNTDLFNWKKRHLKIEYGVDIVEIRYRTRRHR